MVKTEITPTCAFPSAAGSREACKNGKITVGQNGRRR
jgi:hypothetical protein